MSLKMAPKLGRQNRIVLMAWRSTSSPVDSRCFLGMCAFVGNSIAPVKHVQFRKNCTCLPAKLGLFVSGRNLVNTRYLAGRTYVVRKVFTTNKQTIVCSQQDKKGPISGKAWWSGLLTGTIVFALLIPYVANLGSNNIVLTEDEVSLKLRQIPVFAVTDAEGKPFLLSSPVNDNQRDGYFFVDKDDALSFKDVVSSQESDVKPKIFPLTLDVAERFIQGKLDPNYVSSSDRFHLASNVEDLEFADRILKTEFDRTDVPVFTVEKLKLEVEIPLGQDKQDAVTEQPQIRRITPLFLKKQDVENLLSVAKRNSQNDFDPMIRVYKLSELLTSLKRGEFGSLDDFIFYPPEESLEYIRSLSSS